MPQVATALCLLCILYLFWIDRKQSNGVSAAVWIPLIWMFLAGSRFASQWLNLAPPEISPQGYSEGSPLDRNVFLALILAGIWVLKRRMLNWPLLITRNVWIFLFFLFAAMSTLWADDPSLSMKRWIKGGGNLVMALIIATEQRPDQALGLVLRRLSFVLLPLSILFIKFYPDLGRQYHMGMPMFSGATLTKNALGQLCLIVGIYFFWNLLFGTHKSVPSGKRLHGSIYLITLPMIIWLMYVADSATSLVCLIIASCLLLVARLPVLGENPHRIVIVGIACAATLAILQGVFDISGMIIHTLGRRPDLTDRDAIWTVVLAMQGNPLVGVGYESFWTGERLIQIWHRIGVSGIIQAHNGYIDLYVNLGISGLTLLMLSIISGIRTNLRQPRTEYAYAAFRLSIIISVLVYNYTEATFIPVSNMFVLLLVSILEAKCKRANLKLKKARNAFA